MRLEREALSWVHDDFFHFIERIIFEDIVDTPWTVPDLEIAPFSKFFGKLSELGIEGFLIGFVLNFFDEVRGVMCLRPESITDLDSVCREDLGLWDLTSKSVSSLREDDLVIFSCGFRGRDDELE